MSQSRVTKRAVESLPVESVLWDSEVKGFGVRRQRGETRVYVLKYRTASGERRYVTIGRHGSPWTPETARRRALAYLGDVAKGSDPATEERARRTGETVAQLCDRYMAEHAEAHKKPAGVAQDRRNIDNHVKPLLGRRKVRDVAPEDIDRFKRQVAEGETVKSERTKKRGLRRVRGGQVVANRCLALLGKMMALAVRWRLRPDNPVRGVEKFRETARRRFLSLDELGRLARALDDAERSGRESRYAVAAIRLLLFTGCRLGEVTGLLWEHVDFDGCALRLPDSKTGAKTIHLGAPALELLKSLPRLAGNPHAFPGERKGRPIVGLYRPWQRVLAAAKIDDLRRHDLRHTFAAIGVMGGASLPMVGALLGHRQPATTARYAHLAAAPMKAAADKIAGQIDAAMQAAVMAQREQPPTGPSDSQMDSGAMARARGKVVRLSERKRRVRRPPAAKRLHG